MKKILLAILSLAPILLLGCTKQETMTLNVDSSVTTYEVITYEQLQTMMEENQTFVLYVSSATCSSCQEFEPILTAFIEANHVKIFKIEAIEQLVRENDLLPYDFTPTLFFVKAGESIAQLDPINDEKAYESLDSFQQAFDKIVVLQVIN